MYAAADKALYRAKELGRNQIYAAEWRRTWMSDGSTADQPIRDRADLTTWAHLAGTDRRLGWKLTARVKLTRDGSRRPVTVPH